MGDGKYINDRNKEEACHPEMRFSITNVSSTGQEPM
jgi:hypothetical protein